MPLKAGSMVAILVLHTGQNRENADAMLAFANVLSVSVQFIKS